MHARTIKYALDIDTGEVLDADIVFIDKPDAFKLRKKNASGECRFKCLECDQELRISSSKYDRLHFKHLPKHDYCALASSDMSLEEMELYNNILYSKESARHKELKNKIAERLAKVPGVDSIIIDDKFFIRGKEKRRPDVYCKYLDKELVFEIQLSDLSLRYILSRQEFYKKNGMYLIWILDNFDREKSNFKRDIKYLTNYENLFKLDETVNEFRLWCDFKVAILDSQQGLYSSWNSASLTLDAVKFDTVDYQIYHYDFGGKWNQLKEKQEKEEQERKEQEEERKREEEKRDYETKKILAQQKAEDIINEIKVEKKKGDSFSDIDEKINRLNLLELEMLNARLDFKNRSRNGEPILHSWLGNSSYNFWYCILCNKRIELDINRTNREGVSAFPMLVNHYEKLAFNLFHWRSYKLTEADKNEIIKLDAEYGRKKVVIAELLNALKNKELIDFVYRNQATFFALLSAKRGRVVGYNYPSEAWLSVVHNILDLHKDSWKYVEAALKYYDRWDKILKSDKKGKFQKKLHDFYLENSTASNDFEESIMDLFPEILTSLN